MTQKIISAFTAFSLVAALASGALADDKKMSSMKGSSMQSSSMGKKMSHSCAPGKSWVKGYTKKDGTKVKGYCR